MSGEESPSPRKRSSEGTYRTPKDSKPSRVYGTIPNSTDTDSEETIAGPESRRSKSEDDMPEQQQHLMRTLSNEDGSDGAVSDPGPDLEGPDESETKSVWYLILLTVAIGGLQIVWSVELSTVSPFLLSLGLSKSLMALVWIAGPLSGTLVQPYVGIKSDDCRISWGRRRPFMIGGALSTCVSLLLLAWTREIVSTVTWLFGASAESDVTIVSQQIFAIIIVYILDFAINVIQAGIRAFIVDCAPAHQQEDANAWASRITGVGNIVGYLAGYVYLPSVLPFLGHTQFQVLCAIACIILLATLTLSCATVSERDPAYFGAPSDAKNAGVVSFFHSLYSAVRRLPPQIQRVCQVQLFAWIGWFPFLFYITTWIGQIYANPYFAEDPHRSKEDIDAIFEQGTRVGAFALLLFAITTFSTSVLVPFLIIPAFTAPSPADPPTPSPLAHALRRLRIPGLTLRRVWLLSHLAFFTLTWATLLVRSTHAAVALVALIGIPWAITNWAPFALIAADLAARDARRRHTPATDGPRAEQAGIVLGIHNVAIAAPQVVATLLSSAIFAALQKPRGQPGDESLGWVLRVGGVFALGAAWWCRFVADGPEEAGYVRVAPGGDEGDV